MSVAKRDSFLQKQVRRVYTGQGKGLGCLGYLLAVLIVAALLLLSIKIENESEVLFALFYLLISLLVAIFIGQGPGLLTGFLASLCVDYLYIRAVGIIFNSWNAIIFLILTMGMIQLALFGVRLLQSSAKEAEQTKAKLEVAVNARDEILSVIAHDLRQPVALFSLKQQMAIRSLESGNLQRVLELLKEGKASVDNMENLIQDLLDGVKIDGNTLVLSVEPSDLREIAINSCSDFSRQAEGKQIKINFSVLDDQLPFVSIDRRRIGRVFSNLLSNAVKFTPMGGVIEVSLKKLDSLYVQVTVKDTGPGVREESLKHLFEKHWQEAKTAHLGTGLGLYICHGIITAHKGEIWYDSNFESGSAFCFKVPVA